MVRIAFDHKIFQQQKFGGISRYFVSLASEFISSGNQVKIFASPYINNYLKDLPEGALEGKHKDTINSSSARAVHYYNRFISPLQVAAWKPQILHETYYSGYSSIWNKTPVVTTVYDMIHELFSEQYNWTKELTKIKKLSLDRADHIICISESTKTDLINILNIQPDKISVTYLGYDFEIESSPTKVEFNSKPYLLFVGSRGYYKNFTGLLNAVSISSDLKSDFSIIAFGGGGFSLDELAEIKELGFDDSQVTQIEGDDSALYNYYQKASALVYPSLYEGFGLPPLEAMCNDCPVICSNTSSLPEVVGDAGELFDPYEVDDCIRAIRRVVYSEEYSNTLISLGRIQSQKFSWKKCAEETLSIYKSLIK
jgi:glycosyltransferase involved in cell wall biosynthesis